MSDSCKPIWNKPSLKRLSLKDAETGATTPNPLDLTDQYS